MDFDEAAARLTSLTLMLDDSDITQAVHDLARSALAAVPSCLAVLVTLNDSTPLAAVTPRYQEGVAHARSTMRLEFSPGMNREHETGTHRMVFVAEAASAFTDFASFSRFEFPAPAPELLTPDPGHRLVRIVIDQDLAPQAGPAWELDGEHALDGTINRAIGVLIDQGFDPGDALRELRDRAQNAGRLVPEMAEQVLRLRRP